MPNEENLIVEPFSYTKFFDPIKNAPDPDEVITGKVKNRNQRKSYFADFRKKEEIDVSFDLSDRRDGMLYHYSPNMVRALNVAIATGRPLLLRGPSGSGKSSLAYNAARVIQARFYQFVVTSRSQAKDLLFEFEALNRLADAQAGLFKDQKFQSVKDLEAHTYYPYIKPGPFWWAVDKESAGKRGLPEMDEWADKYDKSIWRNVKDPNEFPEYKDSLKSVILIDEIDKADPDFPNNLLVPLGSFKFRVPHINRLIGIRRSKEADSKVEGLLDNPLVIITTNRERRLPEAFLRRCVILELKAPSAQVLIDIAKQNEGNEGESTYEYILELMNPAESPNPNFNVAEYLDAVRAYQRLNGRTVDDLKSNKHDFLEAIIDITTGASTMSRQ